MAVPPFGEPFSICMCKQGWPAGNGMIIHDPKGIFSLIRGVYKHQGHGEHHISAILAYFGVSGDKIAAEQVL